MSDKLTLTNNELIRLRIASLNMYNSVDGRMVWDSLIEDLGLYDEPTTEEEMVLHLEAMRIMNKYFGLYEPRDRSRLTEMQLTVPIPGDWREE